MGKVVNMSEQWCREIESQIGDIKLLLTEHIKTSGSQTEILKYVVTPLLIIVGALAGVQLVT